jgi:magnesium transporter
MEKFAAIAGSHEAGAYMKTSSFVHFKNRAGWITVLAFLGMISGVIVQSHEALLVQFSILATFMPMLADTGGNTGSQSAAMIIRALALREINQKDILHILWKEFRVAIMLGLLLGTIAFSRVLFLGAGSIPTGFSSYTISLSIAIALALHVITSTLIGSLLPLGAAKFKLDPAVVASPALTTIVDITGLLIYFSIAQWLLGI